MRKLKIQFSRLSVKQIAVILLILGLFTGILCANVFHESFSRQLWLYEDHVFQEVADNDINYAGLFRYVLGNNFKDYILFWLLSITILGIPYIALKIISFGFYAGFFISAVTMQYGFKGMLLVIMYVFPHGLVYLPIALISLYRGFQLCREIYQQNHSSLRGLFKPIRNNLFLILLLAIILIFASFLEAYPGAYLLKKTLGLFI